MLPFKSSACSWCFLSGLIAQGPGSPLLSVLGSCSWLRYVGSEEGSAAGELPWFSLSPQTVQVPVYSEQEYQMYLHDDAWTKAETDHLFDLARRFDLRFVVIHDRYDHQQFKVSPGGQAACCYGMCRVFCT